MEGICLVFVIKYQENNSRTLISNECLDEHLEKGYF